jgi:hypothetical protein
MATDLYYTWKTIKHLEVPPLTIDHLPALAEQHTEEAVVSALYELASTYNQEVVAAWSHGGSFPEQRTIDDRWNSFLGIVPSNNFYIRFQGTPDRTAESNSSSNPWLAVLRETDPGFFAKCREVSIARNAFLERGWHPGIIDEATAHNNALEETVVTWMCNLYMTEAVRRLRAQGASEADIQTLCGNTPHE